MINTVSPKDDSGSRLMVNHATIGNTIESERCPITLDEFWFAIHPDNIISPFDFVCVDNILDSLTVGIIKELRTVKDDSFALHKGHDMTMESKIVTENPTVQTRVRSEGIRIAKAAVMVNMFNLHNKKPNSSNIKSKIERENLNIRMPVGINKLVRFASAEEIINALGIPKMDNPIFAGIIEMTNGLKVPIPMAMSYIAGPDSAHVNASGISGNLKTSYLIFLLHSIYQKSKHDNNVSVILFNTRQDDLLHIDEQESLSPRDRKLYRLLRLTEEPFGNVTYFLPRGSDGRPISAFVPPNYKTYSFELGDIYDRLELLLSSEMYDPHYNLSSIVNYIYENWPLYDTKGKVVKNWSDLFAFKEYPQEIITQKSSFLHFLGYLQRFRKSSMFTDKRETSTYLGKEIKKIRPGDVFVIDIAMIPTIEEQSLVVGDVMKNIDELYSSRYNIDNIPLGGSSHQDEVQDQSHIIEERPIMLLIFIDEINRFLPHSYEAGGRLSVAEQIVKTIVAGKTRSTILFSAQQFKSAIDTLLLENTGVHIISKLGLSELSNSAYDMLDDSTKRNITHMDKGEIVMVQPAFRHPIKIIIPRPPFRRCAR